MKKQNLPFYEKDEFAIFIIIVNAGFCLVSIYHEQYDWAWFQGSAAVILIVLWGLIKFLEWKIK